MRAPNIIVAIVESKAGKVLARKAQVDLPPLMEASASCGVGAEVTVHAVICKVDIGSTERLAGVEVDTRHGRGMVERNVLAGVIENLQFAKVKQVGCRTRNAHKANAGEAIGQRDVVPGRTAGRDSSTGREESDAADCAVLVVSDEKCPGDCAERHSRRGTERCRGALPVTITSGGPSSNRGDDSLGYAHNPDEIPARSVAALIANNNKLAEGVHGEAHGVVEECVRPLAVSISGSAPPGKR